MSSTIVSSSLMMLFLFSLFSYLQASCIVYSLNASYDLTAIQGMAVSAVDQQAYWTYNVSVCASTVTCEPTGCPTSGYCQQNSETASYCVGNYQGGEGGMAGKFPGDGVTLQYATSDGFRAGKVYIACNHSLTGAPRPIEAYSPRSDHHLKDYYFLMQHATGCGKAAPCDRHKTCSSCAGRGCSWCLDNNKCVPSNNPKCKNVVRSPNYCPDHCSGLSTCDSCTKQNVARGCGWCLGQNNCSADYKTNCANGYVTQPQFCHQGSGDSGIERTSSKRNI